MIIYIYHYWINLVDHLMICTRHMLLCNHWNRNIIKRIFCSNNYPVYYLTCIIIILTEMILIIIDAVLCEVDAMQPCSRGTHDIDCYRRWNDVILTLTFWWFRLIHLYSVLPAIRQQQHSSHPSYNITWIVL